MSQSFSRAVAVVAIRMFGLLGLMIACLIGYLVWAYYFAIEAERAPFSATAWQEKANIYALSNDPGCVRADMALDIIATELLLGKTVAEITQLLGEPDSTSTSSLIYELGQCSGLGWLSSVLAIQINTAEQAHNIRILRVEP